MDLDKVFNSAIKPADMLIVLYESLLTNNTRAIRSEYKTRAFTSKIVPWPQQDGLWRSKGHSILILGNDNSKLSHHSFSPDSLSVFLRSALVLAMAAIDKLLHEAVSNNFSRLAREGTIDRFAHIDVSTCYQISLSARERKGKGGKIKTRPGHKIKAEVLQQIYTDSFLSSRRVEEVSSALGKKKIFSIFGNTLHPSQTHEQVKAKWISLYRRRNQIAHEGDIVRKSKGRVLDLNRIRFGDIKKDIDFIKAFGTFLAGQLQ